MYPYNELMNDFMLYIISGNKEKILEICKGKPDGFDTKYISPVDFNPFVIDKNYRKTFGEHVTGAGRSPLQLAKNRNRDDIVEILLNYCFEQPTTTPSEPTTAAEVTTTSKPPASNEPRGFLNPNSTMSNEKLLKWASSLVDGGPKKIEAINAIVKRDLTQEATKFGIQIHDLGQAPVNQTSCMDWIKEHAYKLSNQATQLIANGTFLIATTTTGARCILPRIQNPANQSLLTGRSDSTEGLNPNLLTEIIAGTTLVMAAAVVGGGVYWRCSKYQQNKSYQVCLQNSVENHEKTPLHPV